MWGMPDRALPATGAGDLRPLAFQSLPVAPPVPATGTVLAFDYGSKRLGVAVGECALRMAHPLTTIEGEAAAPRFAAIATLVAEWKPALLVVGLPVHMDGTPHDMTSRAARFARQLEGRFNLRVVQVDERLSSRVATGLLHEAGLDTRRQRPVRDQVAAQRILQSWFDSDGRP